MRTSRGEEQPQENVKTAESACKVDFSTSCPYCQVEMQPVHAHYQCTRCGWRDSCCM
jgi:hypothetical protein